MTHSRRFKAGFALGLMLMIVAGQPVATAWAQPPLVLPEYKVGIGDKLKVSVYNSDKLSGDYQIAGDGKIAMPILGRVFVSGLTLREITALLTAQLEQGGYLIDPKVTVDVTGYRSVYILGEVQKPGQYPFTEGMTIYQLVAQAGGFTYRANRKTVKLRHEGEANEVKYSVVSGSAIKPGDTVVIMQRYF